MPSKGLIFMLCAKDCMDYLGWDSIDIDEVEGIYHAIVYENNLYRIWED